MQIRRDDAAARNDLLPEQSRHILLREPLAGRREKDRVEHDVSQIVSPYCRTDRADIFPGEEHADLDRIRQKTLKKHVKLSPEKSAPHLRDRGNAVGVLGGQRSHGRKPADTEGAEDREVCLESGASGRVETCNRQNALHM